jgi:prephenate dehydrogenase
MFRQALYCLIATERTSARAMNTMDGFVTVIGAKPYYLEAAEHDSYIAATRQLPLVTAASLMQSLSHGGAWREMQAIAGADLRGATQLAAADPQDSAALLQQNRVAVARWIDETIRTLVELRDTLGDRPMLEQLLRAAHDEHDRLLAAQPNMRPGESDFVGEQPEPPRGFTSLLFGQRPKRDKKN